MLTLIVFILVLSILVLVHELGHFIVAKKIGVKVEEFGLGYPPRIFGKKIGDTIYSLNALPFGGFVRLYGEESEAENKNQKTKIKNAFYQRSKLERSLILTAGVFMNFFLGVLIISFLFTQGVVVPTEKVIIEQVLPKSPAHLAGLKAGDQIVSINNISVKSPQELVIQTKKVAGSQTQIKINRCDVSQKDCREFLAKITPRKTYPPGEGSMGVAITNLVVKKYPFWQAPYYGTIEAFKMTGFIAKGVGMVVWQLGTRAQVPADVAGPVGIYNVTGQAIKFGGFIGILQLLGLLSLNLAVVNILPIPALDGGRLALVLLETFVSRKKIVKVERVAQSIGVALIFTLIILITLSDLSKLSFIQNFLKNIKLPF